MLRLVPQSWPAPVTRADRAAVGRVLARGLYLGGPETAAFEAELAASLGVRHAVGAASGTAALTLALKACGVRPGDRVATVSLTATATVAAVEDAGAAPVFVDVDERRLTMDPGALAAALRSGPRVRAVVAVHLYGQPADLPRLRALCRSRGAALVEDCAQALGASLAGRPCGAWGDAAALSFHPSKNLAAAGDAGALVTASASAASRARRLREYGWRRRLVAEEPGTNARLDELQAALLRARLPRLAADAARRESAAARYDALLRDSGLTLPARVPGAVHAWHQYAVRARRRDALRRHLRARGVSTAVLYPVPVHLQPAYRRRFPVRAGALARTEAACRELLCLPMSPRLTPADQRQVAAAVRSWRG